MQNHQELLEAVSQRLDQNKLPLPKDISNLGSALFGELAKIIKILQDNEQNFERVVGAKGECREDIWHDFHGVCAEFLGVTGYVSSCFHVLERTRLLVENDVGKQMGRVLSELRESSVYWETNQHIDLLTEHDSTSRMEEIADQFLEAFTEATRLCLAHFQVSSYIRAQRLPVGGAPKLGLN